jgi:preprotein translocase subunit SecD
MTKFEELMDIITRNKNKPAKKILTKDKDDNDIELEVSGSESTRAPLVAAANEETDPDIIDQLYRSNRNRVPRGEGASSWDPIIKLNLSK